MPKKSLLQSLRRKQKVMIDGNAKKMPLNVAIVIFAYLPAQTLVRCRQVCKKWKKFIDQLYYDEGLWQRYCKEDFGYIYYDGLKIHKGTPWFQVYKSLALWPKLTCANLSLKVTFESIENTYETPKFNIIGVKVHEREMTSENEPNGVEIKDGDPNNALYLEVIHSKLIRIDKPVGIKVHVVIYDCIYYVTFDNTLYCWSMNNDDIIDECLMKFDERVIQLSYDRVKNHLFVLTENNIHTFNNKKLHDSEEIQTDIDCCDQFRKCQVINCLNKFYYKQYLDHHDLMYLYNYGDVVFVATHTGNFRAYRSPPPRGIFDGELLFEDDMSTGEVTKGAMSVRGIHIVEHKSGHAVTVSIAPGLSVLLKYEHTNGKSGVFKKFLK